MDDNKEYLLVRLLAGHWDFPKGHVEKGESERETALREVWEETGLQATIISGFRETVTYLIKGYIAKEVVYFLGYPHSREVKIQAEEISDFAFLPYEAARKRLTFESNRQLLDKAQAFVESRKGWQIDVPLHLENSWRNPWVPSGVF